MQNSNIYVIIPAAGLGERMGAGVNKVFLELAGEPVIKRTLDVFQALPEITAIQLVGRKQELEWLNEKVAEWQIGKALPPVAGGKTRQDSVHRGLQALLPITQQGHDHELVLVHDAARCLVTPDIVRRCIAHTRMKGSCVAAMPVKDTIKRVAENGLIFETLDRAELWQIQTPQAFCYKDLFHAYQKAAAVGLVATDDASVLEAEGGRVAVVEGSYENIKITTAEDLVLAEVYLRNRSET